MSDMKFDFHPRVLVFDPPHSAKGYVWERGEVVLCLGEIANMRGHGVFVNRAGRITWGHHLDNFREPTGEEL